MQNPLDMTLGDIIRRDHNIAGWPPVSRRHYDDERLSKRMSHLLRWSSTRLSDGSFPWFSLESVSRELGVDSAHVLKVAYTSNRSGPAGPNSQRRFQVMNTERASHEPETLFVRAVDLPGLSSRRARHDHYSRPHCATSTGMPATVPLPVQSLTDHAAEDVKDQPTEPLVEDCGLGPLKREQPTEDDEPVTGVKEQSEKGVKKEETVVRPPVKRRREAIVISSGPKSEVKDQFTEPQGEDFGLGPLSLGQLTADDEPATEVKEQSETDVKREEMVASPQAKRRREAIVISSDNE